VLLQRRHERAAARALERAPLLAQQRVGAVVALPQQAACAARGAIRRCPRAPRAAITATASHPLPGSRSHDALRGHQSAGPDTYSRSGGSTSGALGRPCRGPVGALAHNGFHDVEVTLRFTSTSLPVHRDPQGALTGPGHHCVRPPARRRSSAAFARNDPPLQHNVSASPLPSTQGAPAGPGHGRARAPVRRRSSAALVRSGASSERRQRLCKKSLGCAGQAGKGCARAPARRRSSAAFVRSGASSERRQRSAAALSPASTASRYLCCRIRKRACARARAPRASAAGAPGPAAPRRPAPSLP